MGIEVLMFDLGKVLIDFSLEPLIRDLTTCCSRPAPEFERVLRSSELAFQYESGMITTAEFHKHLCEVGGLQMQLEEFSRRWADIFFSDLLVSERLLEHLSGKYLMILVSNTNEVHARFIAERYSIFNYFDHKVFSFEVGAMKPDRRIYDHAIKLARRTPEHLFFTDDREENVRAAQALGIKAHRFVSESALTGALRDAGVDVADFIHSDPLHSRS